MIRKPGKDMWGKEKWSSTVTPRKGDTEKDQSQMHAGRISEITLPLGDLAYYNEGQCNNQVVLPRADLAYRPAMATSNLDGNKKLENNLIYDKAGLFVRHS